MYNIYIVTFVCVCVCVCVIMYIYIVYMDRLFIYFEGFVLDTRCYSTR